eukprot:scaffold116068_cov69-Phaeocystis_antarctica.AAC.3
MRRRHCSSPHVVGGVCHRLGERTRQHGRPRLSERSPKKAAVEKERVRPELTAFGPRETAYACGQEKISS